MNREELRKTSVAVLMGGWSPEREISLRTGKAVLRALESLGYRCTGIDVDRSLAVRLAEWRPEAAFIALHGTAGEDGAVQGLLEMVGIPYTGSGILASAVAMNKKVSKWLFDHHGLTTPPWVVVGPKEVGNTDLPFGFPVVVKPVAQGSTIGVSIVFGRGELDAALGEALSHGGEAIVERYIEGREVTIGVLGRRALPVIEVIPEGGFYDYRAKYDSPRTRYVVPAELPPEVADRAVAESLRAVEVIGCRGQARVDLRIDAEGRAYLLEINTIPGMTEASLLPKAAAAAGMSFAELVEEILREALETS